MSATFIVATDLSPRSDRALRRAFRLARDQAARLIVLAVVDDATPLTIAEDQIARIRRSIEDKIADQGDGVACEVQVTHGDPTEDIVGAAKRESADLLILGTHRSRSFFDALHETTAQRITRLSASPVLIVVGSDETPYDRVMLATDFSPASGAAARLAARMAAGAPITPVHALHVPYQGMLSRTSSASALERSFRSEAAQEDRAWRGENQLPDGMGETQIVAGSPVMVFETHVDETGTPLIAIGAHGRVGQRRAVLGSVVTDLMRAPPCDLLICRPANG